MFLLIFFDVFRLAYVDDDEIYDEVDSFDNDEYSESGRSSGYENEEVPQRDYFGIAEPSILDRINPERCNIEYSQGFFPRGRDFDQNYMFGAVCDSLLRFQFVLRDKVEDLSKAPTVHRLIELVDSMRYLEAHNIEEQLNLFHLKLKGWGLFEPHAKSEMKDLLRAILTTMSGEIHIILPDYVGKKYKFSFFEGCDFKKTNFIKPTVRIEVPYDYSTFNSPGPEEIERNSFFFSYFPNQTKCFMGSLREDSNHAIIIQNAVLRDPKNNKPLPLVYKHLKYGLFELGLFVFYDKVVDKYVSVQARGNKWYLNCGDSAYCMNSIQDLLGMYLEVQYAIFYQRKNIDYHQLPEDFALYRNSLRCSFCSIM